MESMLLLAYRGGIMRTPVPMRAAKINQQQREQQQQQQWEEQDTSSKAAERGGHAQVGAPELGHRHKWAASRGRQDRQNQPTGLTSSESTNKQHSHSSGVLMTPPIYPRVQHRCAHLRMPTLGRSQHHRCPSSVKASHDAPTMKPRNRTLSAACDAIPHENKVLLVKKEQGERVQVGTPELDTGLNGRCHKDARTDRTNQQREYQPSLPPFGSLSSTKPTGKNKCKIGAKKKVADPFSKKDWYDVKAPAMSIEFADLQNEDVSLRKFQLITEHVQGKKCLLTFLACILPPTDSLNMEEDDGNHHLRTEEFMYRPPGQQFREASSNQALSNSNDHYGPAEAVFQCHSIEGSCWRLPSFFRMLEPSFPLPLQELFFLSCFFGPLLPLGCCFSIFSSRVKLWPYLPVTKLSVPSPGTAPCVFLLPAVFNLPQAHSSLLSPRMSHPRPLAHAALYASLFSSVVYPLTLSVTSLHHVPRTSPHPAPDPGTQRPEAATSAVQQQVVTEVAGISHHGVCTLPGSHTEAHGCGTRCPRLGGGSKHMSSECLCPRISVCIYYRKFTASPTKLPLTTLLSLGTDGAACLPFSSGDRCLALEFARVSLAINITQEPHLGGQVTPWWPRQHVPQLLKRQSCLTERCMGCSSAHSQAMPVSPMPTHACPVINLSFPLAQETQIMRQIQLLQETADNYVLRTEEEFGAWFWDMKIRAVYWQVLGAQGCWEGPMHEAPNRPTSVPLPCRHILSYEPDSAFASASLKRLTAINLGVHERPGEQGVHPGGQCLRFKCNFSRQSLSFGAPDAVMNILETRGCLLAASLSSLEAETIFSTGLFSSSAGALPQGCRSSGTFLPLGCCFSTLFYICSYLCPMNPSESIANTHSKLSASDGTLTAHKPKRTGQQCPRWYQEAPGLAAWVSILYTGLQGLRYPKEPGSVL
ncbi:hypothetical protein J0S82_003427, partial [Galemys pyrenaicus]